MNTFLLFSFLILFMTMGIPIAFSMGLSSLIVMIKEGIPFTQLITNIFGGMDSFSLLALPFYILTGFIMSKGKITIDLVNFADSLVGHIRGGLAHINVLSSMFFAGVSGSIIADNAAIGSILVPSMIKNGYSREFSAAITASSSIVGPIIPPSIQMVLYGSLANVSIGAMFLGGIIPGILISISLMILSYILVGKEKKVSSKRGKLSLSNVYDKFKRAKFVLAIPAIIIFGIISGVFTATEAGVVACLYSLFISVFVYKTVNSKTLKEILMESAETISAVMFVAGVSSIFKSLLVFSNFQNAVINAISSITNNPTLILFIIIGFVFVMGLFCDVLAIIIIFGPIFNNLAMNVGINPIHMGLIVVMTSLVGAITPPVGTVLFLNTKLANISLENLTKAIWPHVLAIIILILLMACFPPLVTFIPNFFLY